MKLLFLAALAPLLLLSGAPAQPETVIRPEIVATYPHDRTAFTEGLFYRDGSLWESTGLEGQSVIRRVRLEDGAVLQEVKIAPQFFGEGVVDWKNKLISVTWRTGTGFVWDAASLRRLRTFYYKGEGWGLTQDGRHIILSDGTPTIRFLDPETLKVKRRLPVTAGGRPLRNINELEYVRGEILANIWQTDLIARIDPATGKVKGWIDIAALSFASGRTGPEDTANGIAYDRKGDRLFVTGKNWPKLYEIRLPN